MGERGCGRRGLGVGVRWWNLLHVKCVKFLLYSMGNYWSIQYTVINHNGERIFKKQDRRIIESLFCVTAEINQTLYINYISILKIRQNKESSTSFYSHAVVGLFSRSKHSLGLSLQAGLKIIWLSLKKVHFYFKYVIQVL